MTVESIRNDAEIAAAVTAAKYAGSSEAWDMGIRITSAMYRLHDASTKRPADLAGAQAEWDAVHVEAAALCARHGWVAPPPAPVVPFTGDPDAWYGDRSD